MKFKTRAFYLAWHVKDYVVFPSRRIISGILATFGMSLVIVGAKRYGLKLLMKADRIGPSKLSRILVKLMWRRLVDFSVSAVENFDDTGAEWLKKRSLVLKDPVADARGVVIEKGIYLVKFTTTFPEVFRCCDVKKLQRLFHVVLEPSWAGYCLPEILMWASLREPVVVQASEIEDRMLLRQMSTNLIPVDFGSGDWVDPEVFHPIEGVQKEFDVIYIANFNSIKRQYVFFKVLRELEAQGVRLKAALVCGEWGECRDEILDLIVAFGLRTKITFFEDLSQSELNILLNKSKVNILLSLKEGSNRSLFEGFFSGTPGIVLSNNVGVNKKYFNSETGACIPESELGKILILFSEKWNSFSPREWAIENISPIKTTEKLVSAIRKVDPNFGVGGHLERKVSVKVNTPEATLWSQEPLKPVWDVAKILVECRRD